MRTLLVTLTALFFATPAQAQTQFDPDTLVPANVTGDARMVWQLLVSADYLIHLDRTLSVSDPVRIANFERSRIQCQAGLNYAAESMPGSKALLDTCMGFATIVLGDAAGCIRLRAAYPGLTEPAALSGIFADLMPAYYQAATQILTTGACKDR